LHSLIIFLAVIILKNAATTKPSLPYIVSLVYDSSAGETTTGSVSEKKDAALQPESKQKESAGKPFPDPSLKQKKKEDEKRVKEQIGALMAKKKIEKMVALRKMVDIKSSGMPATDSKATSSDYYSAVESRVRQQWIFPESLDKDLETIVSIKINRDGRVIVERIEKSSGNTLFDRSVIRAINKASPLPPPPQDMEMGLRFRP
jgi:colicin import membrane protein